MPVDSPLVLHVPAGAPPGLAAVIGQAQQAIQKLAHILPPAGTPIPPPALPLPSLNPGGVDVPTAYAKRAAHVVAAARELEAMGAQTATVIAAAGHYANEAISNIGSTVAALNDKLRSVPVTSIGNHLSIPPAAHAAILLDIEVALGDAHVIVTVADNLIRTAVDRIPRALTEPLDPGSPL